ncbi:aldo/keto reductase [Dyadobacter sp. UP-52]|uniref:Aldo/keto reductase n=1 Tax=Dyadobacter subterraneus TaxID=2773304 RepID=A0ABR9WHA6_9BACT|nr:aldo/keto reductase [Dyadobacter subterraneus]
MLSSKYNKSISQVVPRWLIQREVVAIPRSTNVKRITENFNVFDFELSADDMATIKSFDRGSGLIYSV